MRTLLDLIRTLSRPDVRVPKCLLGTYYFSTLPDSTCNLLGIHGYNNDNKSAWVGRHISIVLVTADCNAHDTEVLGSVYKTARWIHQRHSRRSLAPHGDELRFAGWSRLHVDGYFTAVYEYTHPPYRSVFSEVQKADTHRWSGAFARYSIYSIRTWSVTLHTHVSVL